MALLAILWSFHLSGFGGSVFSAMREVAFDEPLDVLDRCIDRQRHVSAVGVRKCRFKGPLPATYSIKLKGTFLGANPLQTFGVSNLYRLSALGQFGEAVAGKHFEAKGFRWSPLRRGFPCFDAEIHHKDGWKYLASVKTRNNTTHLGTEKMDPWNLFYGNKYGDPDGKLKRAISIAEQHNAVMVWVVSWSMSGGKPMMFIIGWSPTSRTGSASP
jgi:hypothetical protein